MKIKFNEITWYSKLAAIIIFLGILPVLIFYFGSRYKEAVNDSILLTPWPVSTSTGLTSKTPPVATSTKSIKVLNSK
jgi:hypothetical protein